jgi:hypothetical protein
MTAVSAVSPGRPASPGSSRSQRNPVVSRALATEPSSSEVTWGCRGECRVSHRRGTPGFPGARHAHDARIATLAGVTEVRHG